MAFGIQPGRAFFEGPTSCYQTKPIQNSKPGCIQKHIYTGLGPRQQGARELLQIASEKSYQTLVNLIANLSYAIRVLILVRKGRSYRHRIYLTRDIFDLSYILARQTRLQ